MGSGMAEAHRIGVKRASEGILDIRGVLVYNLNARFGPRLVAVGPSVKAGAPFFRFQ
jgi:hypothetical protein